jgi:hypothetical protein
MLNKNQFIDYNRNNESKYTNPSLREPAAFMQTYRSLRLLTTEMNSITSDYLLVSVGNIAITVAVISNVLLIRHHDTMTPDTLLIFFFASFVANIYMLASYIRLGELNQTSKTLISSRTRAVCLSMRKERDKIFLKFLRSCNQYLRIYMSYFGYYRKPTSIRIIGKIVFYTVRVLILTNKREQV